MLKHTRNTNNSQQITFTMNNIAPKLQKCWTHKIAFNIISKMLKRPDFFYSQPSKLSKDAPSKFYLSTTFGLSFMISSVAPTRSSTFYAYLITKIGNRNLKVALKNRDADGSLDLSLPTGNHVKRCTCHKGQFLCNATNSG